MMNLKSILSALLALVCLVGPASAQIKAGQAIQISISGVPTEESGRFPNMVTVSDSGRINMPYIGWVQASGLTGEALATLLQNKYKEAEIYTSPTFQVMTSDEDVLEKRLVVVGGYVKRPGPVPFQRDMTLWQAVQAAGGADAFGSMKRVLLTRGTKTSEHNCEEPAGQQVRLQPGDSIEVPQKGIFGG